MSRNNTEILNSKAVDALKDQGESKEREESYSEVNTRYEIRSSGDDYVTALTRNGPSVRGPLWPRHAIFQLRGSWSFSETKLLGKCLGNAWKNA